MVLEATMIVLDTSEYMRNGDYLPTRFEAEIEAANVVFSSKTRSNPESTVGLMTLGGEVKTSFVNDISKFLAGVRDTQITGVTRLAASIQVAALALKHRLNKNQRMRLIVFIGSPVEEEERDLVRLAKRMKKNNVAIDIVNFGQEGDNDAKLQTFVDTVSSNNNSHLLSIPPGPHLLSDLLKTSPILREGGSSGAGAGGYGGDGDTDMGGMQDDPFGIDASADPELALALRLSLEEERARQERARQESQNSAGGEAGAQSEAGAPAEGHGESGQGPAEGQ